MNRRNQSNGMGGLISHVLRTFELESRLKEQTCIMVWDEVVGEQVAKAAQPELIRDGRMFVITKSPVWANELSLYKKDMIARLNQKVGENVLKDIVFKAGRVSRKKHSSKQNQQTTPDLEGFKLSDEELSRIESTVSAAGEVSESMRNLMITACKIEKWKRSQGWTPCERCGVLRKSSSGLCPVCEMEIYRETRR